MATARFRFRVQGRGRLVQDEHGRTPHQGAGQRDPLALPARQPGAAFARRCLIALGQPGNELVDPGRARGRLDFGVAGLRAAQPDVVRQGRVEEEAVLEHRAHLKGQRGQGHARHVVVVEAHGPATGVVEAQEQREQRALPGAALAHDGHRLPRGQGEIHVSQHRLAAREREVHGFETDRPAQGRQVGRSRPLRDLRLLVQQLLDTP